MIDLMLKPGQKVSEALLMDSILGRCVLPDIVIVLANLNHTLEHIFM
jgi:hypothetical protein